MVRRVWAVPLTVTILAACSPAPQPLPTERLATPTEAVNVPLSTPVSDSPAAGICGRVEGAVVTVTIYPDIPDPRCSLIRPDQTLRLVNQRAEVLQVVLAGLSATIEPGWEHLFETPFGEFLAPGVHRVEVSPCCGAELWLQETP